MSDDFIPELIEMLSSQMNPAVVCTTAGLCNSEWSDRLQIEYKMARQEEKAQQAEAECGACSRMMNSTVERLRSRSRDTLMDAAFEICGRLGPFSDGCQAVVAENLDKVIQFLDHGFKDRETCKLTNMCRVQVRSLAGFLPLKELNLIWKKNTIFNDKTEVLG